MGTPFLLSDEEEPDLSTNEWLYKF